ncbi:MAG: hypothetical protein AB7S26_03545 [Sandaracinaceae bacterium]
MLDDAVLDDAVLDDAVLDDAVLDDAVLDDAVLYDLPRHPMLPTLPNLPNPPRPRPIRSVRLGPALALLAMLSAPRLAQAQSAQRALLLTHDVDAPSARALAEALHASMALDVVTVDGLTEQLRARAGELGPDPSEARLQRAEEAARAAYVQLQLGEARTAYDEAIAAATASRRSPAAADRVAQLFFERALVALAAHQDDAAAADMASATTIHPGLAPDRSVYGEPVLRALDRARARARRGRPRRLRIERAPVDAQVLVNGDSVGEDGIAVVRGDGPHLVTASRPGYAPRSMLVRADRPETDVGVVLAAAEPALVAAEALAVWEARDGSALAPDQAEVVARAAGVTRVVEATRIDDEVIELVLHAPGSAEPLRSARGARHSWEPRPFHVLAEALAGRVVSAPSAEPDRAPVSLAVTAPERVPPHEEFALVLSIGDPDARLRTVRGLCGEQTVERDLDATSRRRDLRLPFLAPDEETELRCRVLGADVLGETIVTFPTSGRPLLIGVRNEGADDGLIAGLTLLGIGLAAGVAVLLGVLLAPDTGDRFRFVIDG